MNHNKALERNYMKDAFYGNQFKYCTHGHNLMITANDYGTYGYGFENSEGYSTDHTYYRCIAYCTP